jgi:putative methyltransferase (TIGR04325 family)
MHLKIKKIIKNLLPPVVSNFYFNSITPYGFRGEYKDWPAAQGSSFGYDSELILNKTKNALLKVKNGEAVYERDSFLFDKIQYSWPLLASLLYVASDHDNCLNLLDFGGSLGSTYYQNRNFLDKLKELSWSIVEQPAVARCGQDNFSNEHLKFYGQLDKYLLENQPMVALFSASLQYVPEPYKVLDQLFDKKIKYILFDRLVVNNQRDIITIQNVDPVIYQANYPLWIFNEKNILDYFTKNNYELISDFDSLGGNFMVQKTGIKGNHRGYLFKLKDHV